MEEMLQLVVNHGDGENSYVKCTGLTRKATSLTQPLLYKAVESVLKEKLPLGVLNVADLGCAAGPNTFSVMSTVTESTVLSCNGLGCPTPEIQFYFNDLVGNDYNTLFKGLSAIDDKYTKSVSFFGVAAPGSFYTRLFPQHSIHLIHSCFGIHWLSKAPKITNEEGLPLNKGSIFISETSPPAVLKAYLSQFQDDFNLFLKCRSAEMVPKHGRIVFIVNGRKPGDLLGMGCVYTFKIISKAISYMVSKGLIDEEKLDSFNAPIFSPSQQHVEEVVKKERSFVIEFIETIEIELGSDVFSSPELRAKDTRAFSEAMISQQFGDERVMNVLYEKVTEYMVEDSNSGQAETKYAATIVVLKRKDIRCSQCV